MFSKRTLWDRQLNRLSRLVEERRQHGSPILDLTETNPTRAGFSAPASVLALLADPASGSYHPSPKGLLRAREAVAADYARRALKVDPSHVVLTSSTSEAYGFLFKLLCDPGDTILVPRPSYPLFDYLARLEDVSVSPYPLAYDGQWHSTLAALEAAFCPRARAVVVVHPNNPTGSYWKRSETDALREYCAERGLAIIADEVFADFALRLDPERTPGFAEESPALTFSLGGLSKSCGLPQLKLAWIAVSGPRSVRDEALSRLEIVADTYLSVATPIQQAAPAILSRVSELQAPLTTRVVDNLDVLKRSLGTASPATLLDLEGGWSAVLQIPATMSEEERVCQLLANQGILVHPGFFFDFEREAFLVLSLMSQPDDFAKGVRGLLDAV